MTTYPSQNLSCWSFLSFFVAVVLYFCAKPVNAEHGLKSRWLNEIHSHIVDRYNFLETVSQSLNFKTNYIHSIYIFICHLWLLFIWIDSVWFFGGVFGFLLLILYSIFIFLTWISTRVRTYIYIVVEETVWMENCATECLFVFEYMKISFEFVWTNYQLLLNRKTHFLFCNAQNAHCTRFVHVIHDYRFLFHLFLSSVFQLFAL